MDSINKQQPEENRADLSGRGAIEKLQTLYENKTCFFCTAIGGGIPLKTRPMSIQQVDEQGHLWFLSADDSNKNMEIEDDSAVQLLLQGAPHSDFATVTGRARISRDKGKIKELWEPLVKTWFTEGVDDPRITAIEVTPEEGYYWDTKHGAMVAFFKQVTGAVLGKTLDDSVEGELKFE